MNECSSSNVFMLHNVIINFCRLMQVPRTVCTQVHEPMTNDDIISGIIQGSNTTQMGTCDDVWRFDVHIPMGYVYTLPEV